MLGCDLVEVIYLAHPNIMIVDEEGKFTKNKNHVASSRLFYTDWIAGDALVCHTKEFR